MIVRADFTPAILRIGDWGTETSHTDVVIWAGNVVRSATRGIFGANTVVKDADVVWRT